MKHLLLVAIATTAFSLFAYHSEAQNGKSNYSKTDIEYIRGLYANFDNFMYRLQIPDRKIYLPVKAHIIRRSDGTGGLREQRLRRTIQDLNEKFGPTSLQFELCDTEYIDDSNYYQIRKGSDTEQELRVKHYSADVINLYFASKVYDGEEEISGFASMPNQDYDAIIFSNDDVDDGSSLAHEMGHYFCLLDTYSTFNGYEELADGSNCDMAGDLICDTPADRHWQRTARIHCWGDDGEVVSAPYPTAYNLMSNYAPRCRTNFTPQQIKVIYATFVTERKYLYCHGDLPERCESAKEIECGVVYEGSTVDNESHFSKVDYDCYLYGNDYAGADQLFKFYLPTNANVTIKLNGLSENLDLFLLKSCEVDAGCIASSFNSGTKEEKITLYNAMGTFYVVVDGYKSGVEGDFKLSVECNNMGYTSCEVATEIACGETVSGHTLDGINHFESEDYDCYFGGSDYAGREKVFKVDVARKSTLKINLKNIDADLDVFVRSSCEDDGTCLASSLNSNYQDESIEIHHAEGTYYIIVDGYKDDAAGNFKLSVDCEQEYSRPNLACKEKGQLNVNDHHLAVSNLWVENKGTGHAGKSYIGYYLSKDAHFDTNDYLIGKDHLPPLGPFQKNKASFYAELDHLNVPEGVYYLGAIIDYQNDVQESLESDNNDCYWIWPKIVIRRSNPCTGAVKIECGDTVVGNTKEGASHYMAGHYDCYDGYHNYDAKEKVYKVYIPFDTHLKIGLTGLETDLDLFLRQGCSYGSACLGSSTNSELEDEEIVLDNAGGYYYIIIDGYNEDQEGAFELSVTCEKKQPNLVCMERGDLKIEGHELSIEDTWLLNDGEADVGEFFLGYYLSEDEEITTDDYLIARSLVGPLEAGETGGADITVDLNELNIAAGSYFIGLFIDYKEDIHETNESDNNDCYWSEPKVIIENNDPCEYVKEVKCGDWIWGDTRNAENRYGTDDYSCYDGRYHFDGKDLTYKLTVPAYNKVKVTMRGLSLDLDLFVLDQCSYGATCVAKSTNSGTRQEHVTLETGSSAKTYYLVVDGSLSYQNGRFELGIDCETPKPNLVCETRGSLTINGYKISIKDTWIQNTGSGNAGQSHVGYYLSKDRNITKDDYYIGKNYTKALKPGEADGAFLEADLSDAEIPYGWYYVGMILDHKNEVAESNESDNNDCYWTSPRFELPEPNPCDYMKELSCGDWIWGDTRGGANHYGTDDYSCYNGSYDFSGNDAVYKLDIPAHTKATITLRGLSIDQDLFVLDKCSYGGTCLAKSTNSGRRHDQVALQTGSNAKTVYVIIDGSESHQNGRFELGVECESPKPNLVCETRGTLKIDGYKLSIKDTWIQNSGNGNAGQSHVGYYLSADQHITKDDYYIGKNYTKALKPGEADDAFLEVDLSNADIPYGWYYVGMILDHKNEVAESNESDNNDCYWTSPKFELPRPNPCDYMKELSCGDWIWGDTRNGSNHYGTDDYSCYNGSYDFDGNDVVYKVTIPAHNKATITLRGLTVDQDLFVLNKCSYGGTCLAKSTNSGTRQEVVTLETGSAAKTYYLVIDGSVSHQNGRFELGIECASPKPNLVCETRGKLTIDGYKLSIKDTWIQNNGNGNAGQSHVGYYLSKDKNITKDDYYIGKNYTKALKPGEADDAFLNVDLSHSNIPYGWYYVGMIVDHKNEVAESNESDNNDCYWSSPRFELPRPNPCDYMKELSCGDWIWGDTRDGSNHYGKDDYSCYNGSYDYDANDAVYKVKVPAYNKVTISLRGLSVDQDLFILNKCSYDGTCLAKSTNSGTRKESITLETGSAAKTYFIVVDGSDSDDNGRFELGVECVTPKPNLVCETRGKLTIDGYKISIKDTWIQNNGNGNAGQSHVGYYLSKDKNITKDDYYIGKNYTKALKPGEADDAFLNVDLSYSDIPYGWYYVGMIVDHKDEVDESNESDNNDCYWSSPRFELSRPNPCDYMEEVSCGDWIWGDTRNGPDHYGTDDYSCYNGSYGYDANDAVYKLKVPAHNKVTITLRGLSTDQDLFVLNKCSYGGNCIAESSNSGTKKESVTLETGSSAATYYIVVDGSESDQNGRFELGIECETPKPNLVCETRGKLTIDGYKISIKDTWIQNNGKGNAGQSHVGYYLSKDKNITKDDYYIGKNYTKALKPGEADDAFLNVDLAYSDIPYGWYYVGMILDHKDEVDESNESDNNDCYWSSPRFELPRPNPCEDVEEVSCGDWIWGDTRDGDNYYGGDDYSCYNGGYDYDGNESIYKIKLPSNSKVTISLRGLSVNQDLFVLDKCSYGARCVGKSNQSGTKKESVTIKTDSEEETYYIVIDGGRSNDNGRFELGIECEAPQPNLVCKERGQLYIDGYTLSIKNTWVQNSGNGDAGHSHVGYYLSKDKEITTDDYFIGHNYTKALDAGEKDDAFLDVDLSDADIPYGWYYVGMIIDYKGEVHESNEGDNNDCYWTSPRFELPEPDRCDDVIDLSCGDWVWGDTRDAENHFGSDDYDCYNGDHAYDANDIVYQVDVPAHHKVTITLQEMSSNLDLFILDNCDADADCIAKSRKSGTNKDEITLEASSDDETYYIVVDGFKPSKEGRFELGVECEVPQNNLSCACEDVTDDWICDDFESYEGGNYICEQASCWTTKSGRHGGSEDAYVRLAQGNKYLELRGASSPQKIMMGLGKRSSGKYEIKFKVKAHSGEKAYFGLLATDHPRPSEFSENFVYDVHFRGDGSGVANIGSRAYYFKYETGNWVEVFHQIDVSDNKASLYVGGQLVRKWDTKFSNNVPRGIEANTLSSLYFNPLDKGYQYFIDDFEMQKVDEFSDPYTEESIRAVAPSTDESEIAGDHNIGEVTLPRLELDSKVAITGFRHYPNPTTGIVYLNGQLSQVDDVEVHVLNAAGQVVQRFEQQRVENFSHEFDLSAYAKGVYYIRVKSSQDHLTKKVVLIK